MSREKCVILLAPQLPAGMAANAAAILGVTLGKLRPESVGPDVRDGDGGCHRGIIVSPIPVLSAPPRQLRALRERAVQEGLTAVDFSDLAQGCRTYEEFTEKLSGVPEESLTYLGLALCGERKKIDRLTGSLPLLRDRSG